MKVNHNTHNKIMLAIFVLLEVRGDYYMGHKQENLVRERELKFNGNTTNSNLSSGPDRIRYGGVIHPVRDLSIWLDQNQVELFAGIRHVIIHVVANGLVMPHLLDRNLETHLPVIPAEVNQIRFMWSGGARRYKYQFYRLKSHDQDLLNDPVLSIKRKGRIPKKPKEFSLRFSCTGNMTGTASFSIGLEVQSKRRRLENTPLKLRLRKECISFTGDPICSRKCSNRGSCNNSGDCVCWRGWEGEYCTTPVCYPQCMNGGYCSSPGVCDCQTGFQGGSCEVGICEEECLNKGECIQKDTCRCKSGFYGHRCEFSKCVVPCLNGGTCKGVNRCRCERGFTGHHCQILVEDDVNTGICNKQECMKIKNCRKDNCNHIHPSNRQERRSCRMLYCGELLSCDAISCHRQKSSRGLWISDKKKLRKEKN